MASASAGNHEGLSCERPRVVCAQRLRAISKIRSSIGPGVAGASRALSALRLRTLTIHWTCWSGSPLGRIPTPIRGSAQYSFHGLCLDEAFDGSVNHHIDADRRAPSDQADPAHQTIPSNSSQHPQQWRNATNRLVEHLARTAGDSPTSLRCGFGN